VPYPSIYFNKRFYINTIPILIPSLRDCIPLYSSCYINFIPSGLYVPYLSIYFNKRSYINIIPSGFYRTGSSFPHLPCLPDRQAAGRQVSTFSYFHISTFSHFHINLTLPSSLSALPICPAHPPLSAVQSSPKTHLHSIHCVHCSSRFLPVAIP
jgi:hypothetical protein